MKSILLTTTAIVAFAGAAAADGHAGISFSGSTTLGFNSGEEDAVAIDGENGFYWDAGVDVAMTAALDNGVTANASFGFDVVDENGDYPVFESNDYWLASSGFVLSLESENAGLFFGDTEYAAVTQWSSVGDMEADAFSEADGEQVLRGDVTVAGVSASVSYLVGVWNLGINDPFWGSEDEVDQLSVGASGSFGMFSFSAAYQEEADNDVNFYQGDFTNQEVFGVSGGVAVAGADISLGYAQWNDIDPSTEKLTSIGVQVAYPFGPVTATAYFVSEDNEAGDAEDNMGLTVAYADGPIAVTGKIRDEQGRNEWNIDGSYDVGNGLTVFAGLLNENEGDDFDYYVAGTYDLGGGAEVLVAYAGDKDEDQADEIGANEYNPGTTVEVSFSF